jgi:ADP-heptose:LPS heptosyltransferase
MKILIIRLSSIGDIVLTTPVIRAIKTQIPALELHFLTKKQFDFVLINNPYINKIHYLENSLLACIKSLKKEKFDYVIDLHHNFRTLIIKLGMGVPYTVFLKLNFQKWLLVNLKIDQMPKIHIVDRYFKAAEFLEIENDRLGLDYFIDSHEDKVDIARHGLKPRQYVVWVLGGQHFTKQMPDDKIAKVLKRCQKTIVFLGGKEEAKIGESLSVKFGRNQFINLCGKLSFNQSAYMVKHATKVVSNDTGLMHVAAAYKKDILSIWGSTTHLLGMYPYLAGNKSKILEVEGLRCRPCSKIGFKKCPKKHFNCMQLHDEIEIAEWINTDF